MKQKINNLTIISSMGCNLQCKYCDLNETINEYTPILVKKTQLALRTGEFLNNIKQILNKLDNDFSLIDHISLWGAEPILTLHELTANLSDWFDTFINLKSFMFSTNAVSFPDRIIEFIQKVEECSILPCEIRIQLSYDGEWSTEHLRNVKTSNIYNNIKYISEKCNELNLQRTTVKFHCSGALTRRLVQALDTKEKICDYFLQADYYVKQLSDLNKNPKIYFSPYLHFSFDHPANATVQEGKQFANLFNVAARIPDEHFASGKNIMLNKLKIFIKYKKRFNINNNKTSMDYIADIINNTLSQQQHNALMNSIFCNSNFGALKLMYDGKIMHCHHQIHDTNLEYLKLVDDPLKNTVRASLINHNYFANPLESEKTEVERLFYMDQLAKLQGFPFIYQQLITNMELLAENKQILESYLKNKEKLMRHALMLTTVNSCAFNNFMQSADQLLIGNGVIKFYCNGLLDIVDELFGENKGDNDE